MGCLTWGASQVNGYTALWKNHTSTWTPRLDATTTSRLWESVCMRSRAGLCSHCFILFFSGAIVIITLIYGEGTAAQRGYVICPCHTALSSNVEIQA